MGEKYLGEHIPKLGFGYMRIPKIGTEIDTEQTIKMVDLFMEQGFTYFDTAYAYLDERAEDSLRETLVERYPRDSFQLTSKLPIWLIKSVEDTRKYFDISIERLGVEFIDFYLMHAMCTERINIADEFQVWDTLIELKKEGKIKHLGFSFHDKPDVLEKILREHGDDMDFVQLQINYLDWESDEIQSKACYEIALKYKKPIIIMEPVKGGTLATIPKKADQLMKTYRPDMSIPSWAIRYCASLENILTVLSGMSTIEQVVDNLSYMKEFTPLKEEEYQVIKEAVDIMNSTDKIPCTDCKYCVPGCPMNINIPGVFGVWNDNKMLGTEGEKPININKFKIRIDGLGKPSECISCGACEAQCPQHINIMERLTDVAAMYEPLIN
ncbi:MAG: aldo/keto reductase [Eubacteriales bacterium]